MAEALARRLAPGLPGLIASLAEPGPFSPEARAAGRRALRLAALGLLSRMDGGRAAAAAYRAANNMTEEQGALACLLDIGAGQEELRLFEVRWGRDRLVMDKWFGLQVSLAAPDRAAAVADHLTRHPDFDCKNPNRFRAVIGAMSANHAGFHHASGAGYRFVADWLIRLDPLNPQTAARMSTAFDTWARYDADRQAMVRAELERIRATPGLSRDLAEMTGRMLGQGD
jgi:aminopeptidase N